MDEFAMEITTNKMVLTYGGEGLSSFRSLFDMIEAPIFIPLISFAVLFTICFIGSKVRHNVYQVFAILLTMCITAGFFLLRPIPGSVAMLYFALAFVMTATVFILKFIPLSILDYTVMFACFACISRFVRFDGLFGATLPTLYILTVILAVYKIRLNQLRAYLFYSWFASILTAVEGYFFNVIFGRYVLPLGQPLGSNIEKIFVWGAAAFVTVIINLAFIYGIKRLFHKHFDEISRMGKTYPKIERFFIYNSISILLFISALYGYYFLFVGVNHTLFNAFNLFSLFALIIQFSFLIFIFRITWLKDSLSSSAAENQSLAVYSSSLEENMNDIKNIKHDIKNIFLTMGNFVERSDDLEMQAFYREKINPFASEEIAKSDLYAKLAAIDNEQLKAFLFYKISQAIACGITLDLDISPQYSVLKSKIEFADLIRILGIILDNAIEECMELTNGSIVIKITQNDELVSYMIKNTIRYEMKGKGIKAGVSTKGKGRGKGLIISGGILEKYDFVSLNSYFQNNCFVQNLILYLFELQRP